MVSHWEEYRIGDIVNQILSEVEDEGHHFGRPYLTAYQLAIEFDRRHHDIAIQLDKEVGGVGTGEHSSIAQYLALELSKQIRENPEHDIEGAFISNNYVRELSYNHQNNIIVSSLTGTGYSLSMFRLRR
jgi:hypothetical protein